MGVLEILTHGWLAQVEHPLAIVAVAAPPPDLHRRDVDDIAVPVRGIPRYIIPLIIDDLCSQTFRLSLRHGAN